jgi:hypothetical protein
MSLPQFKSCQFTPEKIAISGRIITTAEDLALRIGEIKNSRERSLALTKLEESVMWANKALAYQEDGE